MKMKDSSSSSSSSSWWLTAAISDDTLVASLLLRLKDSTTTSSTPPPSLPPSWGIRQPRSSDKRKDPPRRSPTTPLSFPTSDDSSQHHHHHRSKVSASAATPTTTTTTTSKRPRRKKTFAELKEEVNSLLKERTHLKKELTTLHLTLKDQKSMNEKLKRMKLDLQIEPGVKSEANCIEPPEEQTTNQSSGASEAGSSNVSRQLKTEDEPDSCPAQEESGFVLPDLNMMPDEEAIIGIMT